MGRAEVIERYLGGAGGIAIEMFDGSTAGPADATVRVRVTSPRALNYLATARGDLGLARAYVTGDLEVDGDLHAALSTFSRLDLDLPLRARLRLLQELGGVKLLRR